MLKKFKAKIKETGETFPVDTIWDNSVCLDTTNSEYEWNSWVKSNNKVDLFQYTDLKDKKGKEIFEGDIVRVFGHENIIVKSGKHCYDSRHSLTIDLECYGFYIESLCGSWQCNIQVVLEHLEVIE